MVIKTPICQNIKQIYIQQKNTYNQFVFVFTVILSSLIMFAKFGRILGCRQAYLRKSHRYSQSLRCLSVLILVAIKNV